jgi:hypothetical protein
VRSWNRHPLRPAAKALLATSSVAAMVLTVCLTTSTTLSAQVADPPAREPELVLRDNSFVVEMDGELFLGYQLFGDLDGFVALASPFDDPDLVVDPALEEARANRSNFEVVVTSHAPIEQRSDVEAVLAGDPGPALDGARINFDEVVQLDELQRPIGFTYAIPTATGGRRAAELEFVREGLYPVTVELWRDGSRIARHITFAERLADPAEPSVRPVPFQIAIIAGVQDPGPEPSTGQLAIVRSELTQLRDLTSVLRSPITAIVPPAATREFAEIPEVAEDLIAGLRNSELMVVPSVQLDPSSAVEAAVADAFTASFRAGEDLLAVMLPEVPVRRTAWPATERITGPTLSRAGAGLLRDLGSTLLIISPETYLALSGALPARLLDTSVWHAAEIPGGSTVALGLIDPVSRLLDPQRTADESFAEVAVRAMAEISAQRYQTSSGRRVALLSTPRLGVPDVEVMLRIEEMLERHPGFTLSTASMTASSVDSYLVAGAAPGTTNLLRRVTLPERAGPDLRPRAIALSQLRSRIEIISSMLLPTDSRPAQWRALSATWLSTAYTTAEVDARATELSSLLEEIPAAIQMPEPFTFTLTGQSSEISLRIVNTSDVPLRAVLHAEASKLTFPEAPLDVLLPPGASSVELAVQTLSNGTFAVQLQLRTPMGGQAIGEQLILTARVNALTGLGQVLTGGAVVVLATWWFSHLRKRRRPAHSAPDATLDTEAKLAN